MAEPRSTDNVVQRRRPIRSSASPATDELCRDESENETTKHPKKSGYLRCLLLMFGTIFGLVSFMITSVLLMLNDVSISAAYYELPQPPVYDGALSPNNMLLNAKYILKDEIHGPESILYYKNSIYTGTKEGLIVEIKNDQIARSIKLRSTKIECAGSYDSETSCGRPLGLRIFDENSIAFVDAYHGLYLLDLKTSQVSQLVDGGKIVNGKPLTFLNDLAVLKNGTILFTDSSAKYTRRDFMLNILEHAQDGRLLSYDTKTKELRVLLNNLFFANGVEITLDENFALVSELTNARVLRYHLKGSKAGKVDTFSDNLPGFPDNIRRSSNGTYWVGMAMARQRGVLSFIDFLSTRPWLRSILAKIVLPKLWQPIIESVPGYGLAVQLDKSGKIVSTLHDPKGSTIRGISEIADTGKALYFGSFNAPYIAKLVYDKS
uniref:Strictosidine synthase conserved region domain-containing protein n=1 Tax=Romanomermis culicivorax TaxID=13658 RepID=A0A915KTP8_ROMCU